jgi:hypothetical protein
MLEKLGIAEQMKAKTVNRDGGYIGEVVVAGEADIALQQIPELLAVPGLAVVGPVPDVVQKTFETAAWICSASTQATVAQAMLDFFADTSNAALFADKGLQQEIKACSHIHIARLDLLLSCWSACCRPRALRRRRPVRRRSRDSPGYMRLPMRAI